MVVFEGSSEHGGAFQTRQSYLPREIHWGFQFRPITLPAPPGSTQHEVDISRCAIVRQPPRSCSRGAIKMTCQHCRIFCQYGGSLSTG